MLLLSVRPEVSTLILPDRAWNMKPDSRTRDGVDGGRGRLVLRAMSPRVIRNARCNGTDISSPGLLLLPLLGQPRAPHAIVGMG